MHLIIISVPLRSAIAILPGDRFLACSPVGAEMWRVARLTQVRDFRGHEAPILRLLWLDGGTTTAANSSSGTAGNSGIAGNSAGAQDSNQQQQRQQHMQQLQRLISGSMDNTVRAWNVQDMSGSVMLRERGGGGEISCLARGPAPSTLVTGHQVCVGGCVPKCMQFGFSEYAILVFEPSLNCL